MINSIRNMPLRFSASQPTAGEKSLTNESHPKLDFTKLSELERTEFKNEQKQATLEYMKSYPKAAKEQKESIETHFKIRIFNSLASLITKKIPEATKSYLPDLHKLFSGYDSIHAEMSKADNFNELSEEAQYKLIDTIAEGLASAHEEVHSNAVLMAESIGLSKDTITALRESKLSKEVGASTSAESAMSKENDKNVQDKAQSKRKMKSTWA